MMKKIIFGLMMLIICSMVFAASYNSETGEATVNLNKGWNLVPTGSSGDYGDCVGSINYIYFYSNYQKSYVGVKVVADQPNPGLNAVGYYPSKDAYETLALDEYKYPNSDNNPYYGIMGLGSMWVYTNSACSMKTTIGRLSDMSGITQTFLDKSKLKSGWNFLTISPWMIGKEFKDIFSNCSVQNANVWDNQLSKWSFSNSSQGIAWVTQSWGYSVTESAVGTSFVVKVANDCSLSAGSATAVPPALPGDNPTSVDTSEVSARVTWKAAEPFAITDWSLDGDKLSLVLKNNTVETLFLGGVRVSADHAISGTPIEMLPGSTKTIQVPVSVCSSGKYLYPKSGIEIWYNSVMINGKTQYGVADILGDCDNTSTNVTTETSSKMAWKAAEPFAITDWAKTGSTVSLILKNNTAETLTLRGVQIGAIESKIVSTDDLLLDINPGASIRVDLPSTSCTTGEKQTYPKSGIAITYDTANIQGKTQYGVSDIILECN